MAYFCSTGLLLSSLGINTWYVVVRLIGTGNLDLKSGLFHSSDRKYHSYVALKLVSIDGFLFPIQTFALTPSILRFLN